MTGLQQAPSADLVVGPVGHERNRYADLLRVIAISAVVYGHWVLTDITYSRNRLSGVDALEYVSWGRW